MYDIWKGDNISFEGNGLRPVKTCVYCRVSTEHEEQINALENQKEWCQSFLKDHPKLELSECCYFSASTKMKNKMSQTTGTYEETWVPGFYIDAGKSGREITHREAFKRMISDAKNGKFDLIIVRDNCRFSRNLLDLIQTIKQLRHPDCGVGVYFATLNLFSMDAKSDMMLELSTIMAEYESKETSKRILTNNSILRENNTLFGNGNILGYNLKRSEKANNSYVINEEQAETVRTIFRLCADGLGLQKIAEQLTILKRKNSSGKIKWNYQNIYRLLHNKTYCGYVSYNRCKTVENREGNGYCRQNISVKEADFRKVDSSIVPPIISEELYDDCQEQIQKRKSYSEPKGPSRAKSSRDIFAKKMTCTCGNGFRKDAWKPTADGSKRYGYTCYNVLNNGRKSRYEKNNVATEELNMCDMSSISDMKMHLQAQKVFSGFIDKISCIDETIEAMKKRSLRSIRDYDSEIKMKASQIEEQKNLQLKYINLLASERIDEEQFDMAMNSSKEKIEKLKADIQIMEDERRAVKKPSVDLEETRHMLLEILDCKKDVDTDLIDRFVYQIIVKSSKHFVWRLHFKQIETENPEFVKAYDFSIHYDEAKEYAKSHRRQLKRWESLTVEVEIAV